MLSTLQIKTSNISSTYIWKRCTSKNDLVIEIIYVVVVLVLMLVSIILLLIFICIWLPYTKLQLDHLCGQCPSVLIGLALLWLGNISFEIYHIVDIKDHGLYNIYGIMRIVIMVIAQPVLDIILCVIFAFFYVYKCRNESPELLYLSF